MDPKDTSQHGRQHAVTPPSCVATFIGFADTEFVASTSCTRITDLVMYAIRSRGYLIDMKEIQIRLM